MYKYHALTLKWFPFCCCWYFLGKYKYLIVHVKTWRLKYKLELYVASIDADAPSSLLKHPKLYSSFILVFVIGSLKRLENEEMNCKKNKNILNFEVCRVCRLFRKVRYKVSSLLVLLILCKLYICSYWGQFMFGNTRYSITIRITTDEMRWGGITTLELRTFFGHCSLVYQPTQ